MFTSIIRARCLFLEIPVKNIVNIKIAGMLSNAFFILIFLKDESALTLSAKILQITDIVIKTILNFLPTFYREI